MITPETGPIAARKDWKLTFSVKINQYWPVIFFIITQSKACCESIKEL